MSSLVDENLCHQAILVNYATNTVTSLGPDLVKTVLQVVGGRLLRAGEDNA
jgi:hypothetical protein